MGPSEVASVSGMASGSEVGVAKGASHGTSKGKGSRGTGHPALPFSLTFSSTYSLSSTNGSLQPH